MWGIWSSYHPTPVVDPYAGSCYYLIALILLILLSRLLARRSMRKSSLNTVRAAGRFHQILFAMRWLILSIHLVALIWLGWGTVVAYWGSYLGPHFQFALSLVSSIPVFLSWIGLMWAQYPLDRAVREQNAMIQFELGEKVFSPPSLGQYLDVGIRLQILSMIVPIAVALLLRDGLAFLFSLTIIGRWDPEGLLAITISTLATFLIGPELIRWVLPVVRLPDSDLRAGLESMAKRMGLRYRDILLWNTHFAIGNAAVMGVIPQFRYILLSDLLVESMTPAQIQAVFAHEVGHVKHRHMTWYAIFMLVLILWLGNAESLITPVLPNWVPQEILLTITGIMIFFVSFGLLSRAFERQADLFAARHVYEQDAEASTIPLSGITTFNSALEHVARINNMPLDAGQMSTGKNRLTRLYIWLVHHAATWLHGSIRSRMVFLQDLHGNPDDAQRFDRSMAMIRYALVLALLFSGAWLAISMSI